MALAIGIVIAAIPVAPSADDSEFVEQGADRGAVTDLGSSLSTPFAIYEFSKPGGQDARLVIAEAPETCEEIIHETIVRTLAVRPGIMAEKTYVDDMLRIREACGGFDHPLIIHAATSGLPTLLFPESWILESNADSLCIEDICIPVSPTDRIDETKYKCPGEDGICYHPFLGYDCDATLSEVPWRILFDEQLNKSEESTIRTALWPNDVV